LAGEADIVGESVEIVTNHFMRRPAPDCRRRSQLTVHRVGRSRIDASVSTGLGHSPRGSG
jgi:hypothetical protein